MRRHVCDEGGATHKRVVKALQVELERYDEAEFEAFLASPSTGTDNDQGSPPTAYAARLFAAASVALHH